MINFQSCAHKFLLTISLVLILPITSAAASSTCTCDEAEAQEHKTTEALKYKLVAIVSILIASAAGVSLPFLVKKVSYLSPDKDVFFLIKAFAAGVILATGFIHILPDAFESLTSPCLSENPWHKFPFTGFIAMMSSIGTLMMEAYATGYHKRTELRKAQPFDGDEESDHDHDQQGVHAGHVHGSSFVPEPTNSSDLIRNRIISQVPKKKKLWITNTKCMHLIS